MDSVKGGSIGFDKHKSSLFINACLTIFSVSNGNI
jgi:hypothetical protein